MTYDNIIHLNDKIEGTEVIADIFKKDFHDSGGQCNLAVAKHKLGNTMAGWAVPKNSPYTEALNIGYTQLINK